MKIAFSLHAECQKRRPQEILLIQLKGIVQNFTSTFLLAESWMRTLIPLLFN